MTDERGGAPSSPEEQQQLQAKLQGLERMRLAGLVDEKQYQATRARLQEQLDALGWTPPASLGLTPPVSAPLPPAPAAPLGPPPAEYAAAAPDATTPAPSPATYGADVPVPGVTPPAYQPPPAYGAAAPTAYRPPSADPPPAAAAPPSGHPPQAAYAPPPAASAWTTPPAPSWQQPQPPRPASNLRTAIVATGVALALLATTAGSIAVVTHSTHPATPTASATAAPTASATPAPTPTPDAAATLAALRTAQPQAGQPLITPAQARQLVQAFWPVREQGLSQRNPDTIHAIEDASAGEWDAIGCTYGCPPPSPRPLRNQQVMVPRQTSYPAAFMAQVLTTQYHSSDALVEIMVFTRKAASAPWFLSFDTSYSGLSVLHEFPSGPGSFDEPTPPNGSIDYTTLPSQLATYWQYWKTNGVAPAGTHFVPGAFTSEQGLETYKARIDYRAAGIAEHATYGAGTPQDGTWSFAVNLEDGNGQIEEGDVLTCGTVRFRSLSTPIAPARTVVQDTTYEPYGDLLRPGEYSSVTVTGLHESCMLTRPGSPQIAVEGIVGEQTRVVGVPFSGSGVNA